jgi:serine/threonine protein kinase
MDEPRPSRFPTAPPPEDRTIIGRPRPAAVGPGTVLGHTYRIEARIAGGTMGDTFRARHVELGTAHAVKIIPPAVANNATLIELLVGEVRKLSGVRDEAIINYEGLLRDEQGLRFLVMEFVEGETLQTIMARRRLEPDEVQRLFQRLGRGLAAVHARGIIHRNISPAVIVLPDGDVSRAKLIDFGIAQSMDPGDATLIGVDALARHAYASPEQLGLFGGSIDSRSDIYSLGLVLAAAAIGFGKTLDMGSNPGTMIAARRRVPDLSAVPAPLRPVIGPMLEPRPEARPPSLQAILDGVAPTSRPAGGPSGSRWRVVAVAVGAAAVIALVVGFGVVRFWTPLPSREEVKANLGTLTAGYQCAALDFGVAADRSARVSGHVASQDDRDKLNREVAAIRGIGPVKFDVGVMERPHCEVAAALAPLIGRQKLAPSLGFATKTKDVHMGERLSLDIRAPGFDGYVYIDYFDRGGQVLHLFPNNRDFFNLRPERNHFVVFKPPLTSCWTFNGSIGEELITLIATSKPLFPAPRPEIESVGDYIASLSPLIRDLPQEDGAAAMLQFNLGAAAPWSTGATACPAG